MPQSQNITINHANTVDAFAWAFNEDVESDVADVAANNFDGVVRNDNFDSARLNATPAPEPNLANIRQESMNIRLERLRAQLNPEGIRRASKARSTFQKHQAENEMFVLFLYENYPQLVDDSLCHSLDDIKAGIDYSDLVSSHRHYCQKGKKTLQQRKNEYRIKLLRSEIGSALGVPGSRPPRRTVDFQAFTDYDADRGNPPDPNISATGPDIFMEYVSSKKKSDGGVVKGRVDLGYRSSLTYLFKRYRVVIPPLFQSELSVSMEGIVRLKNQFVQSGDGDIIDGCKHLSTLLYEQFNDWFLVEVCESCRNYKFSLFSHPDLHSIQQL